ncbi:MAG TPA: hypothetical protein VE132_13700, partial [Micromonosporaceae bacterium]|nr:hypothetical protein [Micromonosporaceae bacterium]
MHKAYETVLSSSRRILALILTVIAGRSQLRGVRDGRDGRDLCQHPLRVGKALFIAGAILDASQI